MWKWLARLRNFFRSDNELYAVLQNQDEIVSAQADIIDGLNDALGQAYRRNDQLTRVFYAAVQHQGGSVAIAKDMLDAVYAVDYVGLNFNQDETGDVTVSLAQPQSEEPAGE